jgi:Mg/Co/Ni transporter MgtE
MYQMAGISQRETSESDAPQPMLPMLAYRTLWLLASLPIAMFVGWLMGSVIGPASPAASLMCFAPLVIVLGLLAARQTQTFAVRSLTLGYLRLSAARALLNRELAHAAVVGTWVGGITLLIGWLWFGALIPALILGGAALGSILLASLTGVSVPLLWKAHHGTPTAISAFVVVALSTTESVGCLICLSLLAQSLGYL